MTDENDKQIAVKSQSEVDLGQARSVKTVLTKQPELDAPGNHMEEEAGIEESSNVAVARNRAPIPGPVIEDEFVIPSKPDETKTFGSDFELTGDGLYYLSTDKHGQVHREYVSAPIIMGSTFRTIDGSDYAVLAKFLTRDGEVKELLLDDSDLVTDIKKSMAILTSNGFVIRPLSQKAAISCIAYYAIQYRPRTFGLIARQNGFLDDKCDAFVLEDQVVSIESRLVRPASGGHETKRFQERGSLGEWKKQIGILVKGNAWLIYSLGLAVSSPLAVILKTRSPGVHVHGRSRKGKSSLGLFIASVWGDPNNKQLITSWNATTNGLEIHAGTANHTVICLDEIHEASPKEVDAAAYMIQNGKSRLRMKPDGSPYPKVNWNSALYSTGEVSVADRLAAGRREQKLGQEARIPSIPIECRQKLVVFEDLHGQGSSKAFVEAFSQACKNVFGVVGPAYVEALVSQKSRVETEAMETMKEFIELVRPSFRHEFAAPVADSFALVAAAAVIVDGYLGFNLGKDEIFKGVEKVFTRWMDEFDFENIDPVRKVLRIVADELQSRRSEFLRVADADTMYRKDGKIPGYKEFDKDLGCNVYYIYPKVFSKAFCKANKLNPNSAWKLLHEHDLLLTSISRDGQVEGTVRRKIESNGNERYYAIKDSIFVQRPHKTTETFQTENSAKESGISKHEALPGGINTLDEKIRDYQKSRKSGRHPSNRYTQATRRIAQEQELAPQSEGSAGSKEIDDAVVAGQSSSEIEKATVGSATVKASAPDFLEQSRKRRANAQDNLASDEFEVASTPESEINEDADHEAVQEVDDSIFS